MADERRRSTDRRHGARLEDIVAQSQRVAARLEEAADRLEKAVDAIDRRHELRRNRDQQEGDR